MKTIHVIQPVSPIVQKGLKEYNPDAAPGLLRVESDIKHSIELELEGIRIEHLPAIRREGTMVCVGFEFTGGYVLWVRPKTLERMGLMVKGNRYKLFSVPMMKEGVGIFYEIRAEKV